jgi:hypothetical protein
MRRILAPTLVGVLVLGALAAPAAASKKQDKVTARKLVLRAKDLPGVWTSTPPDDDDSDVAEDKRMARCLGIEGNPNKGRTAEADGRDFESEQGVAVSSGASVFETRRALNRSRRVFESPDLASCFEKFLRRAYASDPQAGVTLDSVAMEPLTIPGADDDTLAYRATIGATGPQGPTTVYVDELLAWKGRYGTSAQVTSVFAAVPSAFEADLLDTLVDKLDANT